MTQPNTPAPADYPLWLAHEHMRLHLPHYTPGHNVHDTVSAALASQPAQALDVEAMLKACVPGGSVCDPQQVADAIREWVKAQPAQADAPNLACKSVQKRLAEQWGYVQADADLRQALRFESDLAAQAMDDLVERGRADAEFPRVELSLKVPEFDDAAQGGRVPEGSARRFIEWCKAQPEDREPTTLEGALAEFESQCAASPVAAIYDIEKALSELIDKICPGIDSGDLLADAAYASRILGATPPASQEQAQQPRKVTVRLADDPDMAEALGLQAQQPAQAESERLSGVWNAALSGFPVRAQAEAGTVGVIPPVHVGRLSTVNQDEYPGLDAWWVQLWDGSGDDAKVVARVYGATPEQADQRAEAIHAALQSAQAVGEREPVLLGRFHHGEGFLCSGSIRVMRADFDTNPSAEFQQQFFDWVCEVMNRHLQRAALANNQGAANV